MNIATLYARVGLPGMTRLAEAAGLKLSYVMRFVYETRRRPSIERASLLISVSERLWPGRGLTLEGLTNPITIWDAYESTKRDGTILKQPRVGRYAFGSAEVGVAA